MERPGQVCSNTCGANAGDCAWECQSMFRLARRLQLGRWSLYLWLWYMHWARSWQLWYMHHQQRSQQPYWTLRVWHALAIVVIVLTTEHVHVDALNVKLIVVVVLFINWNQNQASLQYIKILWIRAFYALTHRRPTQTRQKNKTTWTCTSLVHETSPWMPSQEEQDQKWTKIQGGETRHETCHKSSSKH